MSVISIITLAMVLIFVFLLFYFVPIGMWIQGVVSLGIGRITIIDLIRMRLRKISPRLIVDGVINTHKAGLTHLKADLLGTHYLAGGNVANVVVALIASDKAKIHLTFETATAIDLAGRDVKTAVETSVYPKVIDAPREGYLSAVAKDGVELKARARVTVRTNIPGLVGGATDDTIIARVGEGIVSAIGSSISYGNVLELQADQAEADLRVAQAKAETRRAMAVAEEQEMKARTQEMQAKVVESEAEVPLAMAQAFREGKLGVFDYVNMRNIQADTSMRESISGGSDEGSSKTPNRDND